VVAVALSWALLIAGCGDAVPEATGWTGTTDVLASGAIHVRNGAGGLWVVRRAVEPPPVTAVERDSAIAAFQERMRETGGRADRDPRIPQRKSALGVIHLDEGGRLWTLPERERGELPIVDVFDTAGRYLGAIDLPARLPADVLPRITRGRLYTVVHDDLDVSHLIRYRIHRP
jgi:hypothetical protein